MHRSVLTQYDGPEFGLNDVESYINVLEIDSTDNVWFGLRKTDGEGLGLGKFGNNEWMEINNPGIIPDPRINDIAFDAFDSCLGGNGKRYFGFSSPEFSGKDHEYFKFHLTLR